MSLAHTEVWGLETTNAFGSIRAGSVRSAFELSSTLVAALRWSTLMSVWVGLGASRAPGAMSGSVTFAMTLTLGDDWWSTWSIRLPGP
jgi:hypothetical protein